MQVYRVSNAHSLYTVGIPRDLYNCAGVYRVQSTEQEKGSGVHPTRLSLDAVRVARMTCCSTESEKFSSAVVASPRLMQGWERE